MTFELPRRLVLLYGGVAVALSLALVVMSAGRGPAELLCWLAAYATMAVLGWRRPSHAPLLAGFAAFVLGFARTYRHGPNLDLGLSLVLLALAIYLVRPAFEESRLDRLDLGGLLLLLVAVLALVSLGFTTVRIRGFAPAPGFGYHVYRINALGLSSEEALRRALLNAAVTFSWFGAYVYARAVVPGIPRRPLGFAVFCVLALNSAVLVVQTRFSPGFLHPAGWPYFDRWNGITSFCYALGDAALGFFLLLPLWGHWRGRHGLLTAATLLLILHGVVASGSRTALAAMIGAALLWAILRALRWWPARRGPALAAVAAALTLVASLLVVYRLTPPDNSTPVGRLKEGFTRQGVLGHLVATRLGSYPLTLRLLREYPLTGIGVGLYTVEIDKYRSLLLPDSRFLDPFLVTSNAPNQLLNTGAELGVPATLALAAVLLLAIGSTWRARRDPLAGDLGVSALVLLGALQLGPGLYNSEAVVFEWLVVGGAAAAAAVAVGAADVTASRDSVERRRTVGRRASELVLVAVLGLGAVGHLAAAPALSIERQWQRLRWRMNIGMQPQQADGQWTGAEATFSVDAGAPALALRWHAGDARATSYRPEVSFFVDGQLVERTVALPGRVRESVLPLPAASGFKRVSVRVAPPFVPAQSLGGDDQRALGVFLHSVTPRGERTRTP